MIKEEIGREDPSTKMKRRIRIKDSAKRESQDSLEGKTSSNKRGRRCTW
jgi:hypothetical protein